MTLIGHVFLNLRLGKMWFDKCLKSPCSEEHGKRGKQHAIWETGRSTVEI